jgi:RimJ/RimL family protein N-acetyltransferase
MDIRQLHNGDLEKLLALYIDLHNDDDPSSLTLLTETWNEIQQNPRIKYFGVFIQDQLVSTCNITIIPNLTRACRPYGLIENVVTEKSHRRKAYGKSVLNSALEYAWSMSCYKVMLMTGSLDKGTYAFYESAGFNRLEKQAFVIKR